jgi:hypothetical protein
MYQHRALCLATLMVHHANHLRPNLDGSKIGGHQALTPIRSLRQHFRR